MTTFEQRLEAQDECRDCHAMIPRLGMYSHQRAEHPTPAQKSANTRRRNQLAQEQAAKEAKARMVAVSGRVVEQTHYMGPDATYGYDMKLTYQVAANEYQLPHYRRPMPEALARIAFCEEQLRNIQNCLELAKADAWETGAPVTEAEVLAARKASAGDAVTPVTCARCGQPVTTFAQWFSETCPQENPAARDWGHKLGWAQIMALQLRPTIQQEVTP